MANPLGDRLTAALRALETQLSGGIPDPLDLVQLEGVERWVGAKRPLSEYAPRTRRRYLEAARKGEQRPNKREYERRKQRAAEKFGGASPSQMSRLRRAARRNEQALRREPQNANFSFGDEFLEDVANTYGPEFLDEVLREQWDSINEWDGSDNEAQGPHHKGNRRYFGREDRESRIMRMRNRGIVANTDALYYYHGRT